MCLYDVEGLLHVDLCRLKIVSTLYMGSFFYLFAEKLFINSISFKTPLTFWSNLHFQNPYTFVNENV